VQVLDIKVLDIKVLDIKVLDIGVFRLPAKSVRRYKHLKYIEGGNCGLSGDAI